MSDSKPGAVAKDQAAEIAALKQALEDRTRDLHTAQMQLETISGMAAVGRLVSDVTHELRGSLGAMLTSLHLVETKIGEAEPRTKSGIDRIRRSIRRCDDTIGKLLDLSRQEALVLEPTRMDQWLRALTSGQRLPEGVSLAFEPGLGDRRFEIDRDRFARALVQVIENASQSIVAGENPGRITVSTRLADGQVEIRIADNGPGIPDNYRTKIFEPLFSAGSSGAGLGLSVARRIVEQHGGMIVLADESNGDETCFMINLPASEDDTRKA